MRTQRLSVLLRKRFSTPNWIKVSIFLLVREEAPDIGWLTHQCLLFDSTRSLERFTCLLICFCKRSVGCFTFIFSTIKKSGQQSVSSKIFLPQLKAIGAEARQILPQNHLRKHRRADSNGSTTSSRSNPLRDDRMSRSNTQRARSHLLESHLAKLFKQKMEIFTKVEFTQVRFRQPRVVHM